MKEQENKKKVWEIVIRVYDLRTATKMADAIEVLISDDVLVKEMEQ